MAFGNPSQSKAVAAIAVEIRSDMDERYDLWIAMISLLQNEFVIREAGPGAEDSVVPVFVFYPAMLSHALPANYPTFGLLSGR
jgi:hypothetical protein